MLFAITLWWIWKWRNDAIFSNKLAPLQVRVNWIISQWIETNNAFTKAEIQMNKEKQRSWKKMCWAKPQGDFMKINVDGIVNLSTNRAGCGGILRDSKGEWRGGFVNNMGVCSPLQAEAWALLRGIQVATQLGCRKVIFECDLKEVVEAMNKSTISNTIAQNIVSACKKEIHRIETWKVAWIAREQNATADKLATLATVFDRGLHILKEPPQVVIDTLEDEAAGIPCWRNAFDSS